MRDPGDVVTIMFAGVRDAKPRPAVVVSTQLYHRVRPDIILGLLTSEVTKANAATDYVLQDWQAAGLRVPSAFRAFLITRPDSEIRRNVGRLSDRDWQEVQARLRLALAVT